MIVKKLILLLCAIALLPGCTLFSPSISSANHPSTPAPDQTSPTMDQQLQSPQASPSPADQMIRVVRNEIVDGRLYIQVENLMDDQTLFAYGCNAYLYNADGEMVYEAPLKCLAFKLDAKPGELSQEWGWLVPEWAASAQLNFKAVLYLDDQGQSAGWKTDDYEQWAPYTI